MNPEVVTTLGLAAIAMIGTQIAGLVTGVLGLLKAREALAASTANAVGIGTAVKAGEDNASAIADVHVLINSQLSAWKAELMAATAAAVDAALAKGIAQGADEERVRALAAAALVRSDKAADVVAVALETSKANEAEVKKNTEATAANTAAIYTGDRRHPPRSHAARPKPEPSA